MGNRFDINKKHEENNFINRRRTNIPNPISNQQSNNNNQNKENDNKDNNANNKGNANNSFGIKNRIFGRRNNDDTEMSLSDIKIRFPKIPLAISVIIIFFSVVMFLSIYIVLFDIDDDEDGKGKKLYGLNGYEYYSDACSKVKVNEELIDMDEYVAGVISKELGGIFSDDTLKVFSVAARTMAVSLPKVGTDTDNCYYEIDDTTDSFQVYEKTSDEKYHQIAKSTTGLIITIDGNVDAETGSFDASCVYTYEQAKEKFPDMEFESNNYYIKYGGWTLKGDYFQEIYKYDNLNFGTLLSYINSASNGQACQGNHGGGMSQNGSEYLVVNKGYGWKDVIDYYFNQEEKIMSIYPSYGYGGEYPIDPTNELYSGTSFLINESFSDFLIRNGSNIESFNENLKSSIEGAGVGTRSGVVTAAVTLIGTLADMGVKLNYQWGGKYTKIGSNPNWGSLANMTSLCQNYADQGFDKSVCTYNYQWSSFDCSGFVNWALINGMQSTSVPTQATTTSYGEALSSKEAVCDPGGTLVSDGHIVLVVGIDEEKKSYIVAESTGSRIDEGIGGVKLSYYSFNAKGYVCKNLNDLYGD